MFIGNWNIDSLLTFSVNTNNISGVETDADALPTYRVYEDETGVPIVTGSMAKLDDANTTGYYSEQLLLSAANGFEVGKSYNIRISATVGGVTGSTVRNFQISSDVITALNARTLPSASYATSVNQTIINDNILSVGTTIDSIKLVTDHLATTIVLNGATYRFTADALSLAPTGGGLAVQDIVDGVLNELTSAHTIPGSVGEAIGAAGIAGDPLLGEVEPASGSLPAVSLREAMRLFLAFLCGKTTGGGTDNVQFRDINDVVTRLSITVDAQSNRLTVSRDVS